MEHREDKMQNNHSYPSGISTKKEPQTGCCYTVENLMDILGVGRKAVYALIREKAFPAIRISKVGYRIPKDSFYAWLYQQ